MLRPILVAMCLIVLGCSKPTPAPAISSSVGSGGTRDLAAASRRFREALSAGKVDGLLAPQVLIANANAESGCREPAEPCVKTTLSAEVAARELVQQIEGFTFNGSDGSAKDLGCDATCCRYGAFRHGDHRRAISQVCFDEAADPKVTKIVAE